MCQSNQTSDQIKVCNELTLLNKDIFLDNLGKLIQSAGSPEKNR